MGRISGQEEQHPSMINSINVGTVSALEDTKKLITEDTLGVKPTELCMCRENDLNENKFIKSISESTQIVDGRVKVQMPWKDNRPPTKSNYDLAYERMISSEKMFKKKECLEVHCNTGRS